MKPYSAACDQNCEPILAVLKSLIKTELAAANSNTTQAFKRGWMNRNYLMSTPQ